MVHWRELALGIYVCATFANRTEEDWVALETWETIESEPSGWCLWPSRVWFGIIIVGAKMSAKFKQSRNETETQFLGAVWGLKKACETSPLIKRAVTRKIAHC